MSEYAKMADLVIQEVPNDYNPLERQRDLQETLFNFRGGLANHLAASTLGELLERVRFNKEAIDDEFQELKNFLPWKYWKTYPDMAETDSVGDHRDRITELKFELVDIFHFMLNIAIALDMTWEELLEIFETKQVENRDRQQRGY